MPKRFLSDPPKPTAAARGAKAAKVVVETGHLYRARRGSSTWYTWGETAMLAITGGRVPVRSGVQVMSPMGVITVMAGDLRPLHGGAED